MSLATLERAAKTGDQPAAQLGIVDCDIHPAPAGPRAFEKYIPERWKQHLAEFGANGRQPFLGALRYPRYNRDGGSRLDAKPPSGLPSGGDLEFMRQQHLDANNIEIGLLQPIAAGGTAVRNQELGAVLCSAANEWQLEQWCAPEPRLRAALVIPQEDATRAVAEIDRCAPNRKFAQIFMHPRGIEPHGRERYWPIYEAAEHYDLPIGIHVGGSSAHSLTGSGTHSFYIEDHHLCSETMQAIVTSMIAEGVFERFPKLRIVLTEGGFIWAPALCWRMDKHWKRFKAEVPQLKRLPSEYLRDHFWFTTQPIDEPEKPRHLAETIEWLGWNKIMFSSDYPHWDFDDPKFIFKFKLTEEQRRLVYRDNAAAAFRLN